jgi:glycosyltransferase involved in cell wall biosynthesis
MNNVTVLLPVHNGQHFLFTSMRDIESNLQGADEILVVDDGSTDDTPKVLRKWAARNTQVRVITTPGLGLVNALNLGIREASYDWVARFDVDDRYSPVRIHEQRNLISDSVSGIFCDYQFNNPQGRYLGVIPTAVNAHATAMSLISSQRSPHPGVMFNRKVVLEVGGYRQMDFPAEDISLWLRMAKVGKLLSVPKVLLEYQLSKSSVSARLRNEAKHRTNQLLKEIGIDRNHVDYCAKNWSQIFDEYSKLTNSGERKLLYFRDLDRNIKMNAGDMSNNKEIRAIAKTLLRQSEIPKAFGVLLTGKTQRTLFRIL